MDSVNDEQDTEAVETTVEDAEEEIVVQEQQSNIAQLTNDSSHSQCQSYSTWLADWTSHLKNSSHSIRVPPEATAITTPLQPKEWQRSLSAHPDTSLVTFSSWALLMALKSASTILHLSSVQLTKTWPEPFNTPRWLMIISK